MDAASWIQIILLGIVQGIAEFLPISSSGHLVIIGSLLPGQFQSAEENLALNVALHLGTLGSILVVFRKDLPRLLTDPRLITAVIVATLPVVLVGLTLKKTLEAMFETPALVAGCLLITALLLMLSEWLETPADPTESTPVDQTVSPQWLQALAIGLFQALALLPGISRAGSTIAGAVMVGLNREQAARFSFLIAIPAISGAVLLQGIDMLREPELQTPLLPLLVGAVIAFLVGIGALELLLRLVKKNRLRWFVGYCAIVSLLTFTAIAAGLIR